MTPVFPFHDAIVRHCFGIMADVLSKFIEVQAEVVVATPPWINLRRACRRQFESVMRMDEALLQLLNIVGSILQYCHESMLLFVRDDSSTNPM